jgi:hypothetical protein
MEGQNVCNAYRHSYGVIGSGMFSTRMINNFRARAVGGGDYNAYRAPLEAILQNYSAVLSQYVHIYHNVAKYHVPRGTRIKCRAVRRLRCQFAIDEAYLRGRIRVSCSMFRTYDPWQSGFAVILILIVKSVPRSARLLCRENRVRSSDALLDRS